MRLRTLLTAIIVLLVIGCKKDERLQKIEKIKKGDPIGKVEMLFGKPDAHFTFAKSTFPNMKGTTEDSIQQLYYKATDVLNSNGFWVYTDSKKVLYVSINDW